MREVIFNEAVKKVRKATRSTGTVFFEGRCFVFSPRGIIELRLGDVNSITQFAKMVREGI